ncbi:MAG: agmatinase [Thermodesulfobacteriota bacterium]|nr:agmatinase [Thermodesulfobacteriota bacterium]
MNFGDIDARHSSFKNSQFVVIPVPYDLTSTYQPGSRRGPEAIINASCNLELYDEELSKETYLSGIHTMAPLAVDARGPEEMLKKIYGEVLKIISYEKIPVLIGGEHSISVGSVRALKEKHSSLTVMHLDAHADMRDSYQNTPFSHAAVGRRIFEMCPLVQVGIRSMSKEEALFIREHNIKILSPEEVEDNPDVIEGILDYLSDDVYLSIDLDVLDPSIMPATGTPEPGGIRWRGLLRLIKKVSDNCTIRGFDVVELCPIPGMVAPDFTAAKLIYRLMGYIDSKNKR